MEVTQKPRLHASWIDPFAKDIVEKLQRSGFKTFLVGGCVRDLLAGFPPKDFDIATDAQPQEVRRKVPGAYVIGRRFRLVLVKRGDQQYEVATFRRESTPEDLENQAEGDEPVGADNFFGTPEQDALRRDFTFNSLFYDPVKDELIDYTNGVRDIENQIVRVIGVPDVRIKEDCIRSLRAIRLSHKLSFKMEESLREAIRNNADLLATSAMPRRREEYLKIMRLREPGRVFLEMYDLGLLKSCLPSLHKLFESQESQEVFLHYMDRWHELLPSRSTPVEMYSVLLWAYSSALGGMKDFEETANLFMKDELGVFKAEATSIFTVFQLQKRLRDVEAFKKRGVRRQAGFLKHDALPMAVRLAGMDYMLSAPDLHYWENQLRQAFSHPSSQLH